MQVRHADGLPLSRWKLTGGGGESPSRLQSSCVAATFALPRCPGSSTTSNARMTASLITSMLRGSSGLG